MNPTRHGTLSRNTAKSELPIGVPSQFPVPSASTGTIDDDDEPEDEHDAENEASEGETRDDTEVPEELERDDEDGV